MEVVFKISADIGTRKQVLESVCILKVVNFTNAGGSIDVGGGFMRLPVDVVGLVEDGPACILCPVVDAVFGIEFDEVIDLEVGVKTLDDIDLVVETGGIFLL